jgi:hypothetical protein
LRAADADVAISTQFGAASLAQFKVITEESSIKTTRWPRETDLVPLSWNSVSQTLDFKLASFLFIWIDQPFSAARQIQLARHSLAINGPYPP